MSLNQAQSAPRVAFALVATAAALCAGCSEQDQVERPDTPVPVRVWRVQPSTFRRAVRSVADVRAARRVEVRAEVTGHIEDIRFRRGREVSAGDVLMVIRNEELKERLTARMAQLDELKVRSADAERSYQRYLDVYEEGAATPEEMDRIRSQWKALEARVRRVTAEVELLREQVRDTQVRTLTAGTMADHLADKGDFVNIGDPLATLVSRDALELHFSVGQQDMDRVALGQSVEFTVDTWPERTFTATVSYVAPQVLPSTQELPLIALMNDANSPLRPGTFAKARLITDVHRDVPTIPEEALITTRTGYQVFIIEGTTARRQRVSPGLRRPGWVEIRQGLEIGETVVRAGQLQLRDGQEVRIVADTTARPPTQPATRPSDGNATAEGKR
jgi:membrane fusion protein (multidrug efflux system)